MYPELKDRVAIISGAAGALGSALAERFHAEGIRLGLIDRSEQRLQETMQRLKLPADQTVNAQVDLSRPDEINHFLDGVIGKLGRLDILVNVAGAFTFSGPVYKMNLNDLDAMLSANTKTAFNLSALTARKMVERNAPGRIINIGAKPGLHASAGMSAYSASKAAVLRLTESMAAELLDHGITVNAVVPSTLDTPANRRAMPKADPENWVTPQSLSEVITFLASDAAKDISGAAIPVYRKS